MIKLLQATLSYGDRYILDRADWMLGDGDRVGLVGENGSGKSTLIKVMAGMQGLDFGRVEKTSGLEIGYLPQEQVNHKGRTLEEEAKTALAHLVKLEALHEEIEEKLESEGLSPEQQEALLKHMAEVMDSYQLQGGYEAEAGMKRILFGLGFSEDDLARPVQSFSGGWQMRIALAKILLQGPGAMLLDEPTNHLDVEARDWLESFLEECEGSYLVVSHDRYFLDVVTERIVEIENGRLCDYRGNYSFFLAEKRKRIKSAQAAYDKQQQEIKKIKSFISKYKADKKRAGQVQSRAKRLTKMEALDPPPQNERSVHFKFPPPPRGPLRVVSLEGVGKSFGHTQVLSAADVTITRSEKVAVVGKNGSGKSTLLSIIAGRMEPDAGTRRQSPGVEAGYFGQEAADGLYDYDTVYEAIEKHAPFELQPRVRSLLGAFLFSGEDVDKKVKALSGGERSRLALAKLLLRPANLLVLDEPTNHLDLKAKEVLMQALKEYTGALVFVSHDRYFLENLPHRVLEVRGREVASYPGVYSDYLLARERRETGGLKKSNKRFSASMHKRERKRKRQEVKDVEKQQVKTQKRMKSLEGEIEDMEREMEGLEKEVSDPGNASDYQKLMELEDRKKQVYEKIEALYGEWEELAQSLPRGKEGAGNGKAG